MWEKSEYRALVKARRRQMTADEAESRETALCEKLLNHPSICDASWVYCYISKEKEAGTRRFIEALWSRGRAVAAPRVEGKGMAFYQICSWEDLETGCMGIWEPKTSCIMAGERKAPVIVPGLAFDPLGHRIGYGGGYYDRFLEAEPEHPAVGAAYGFQIFPEVPAEPHDRTLDSICIA